MGAVVPNRLSMVLAVAGAAQVMVAAATEADLTSPGQKTQTVCYSWGDGGRNDVRDNVR